MSNGPGLRTITVTCKHCGHVDTITADISVDEMMRRLNESHDSLSPYCSKRYAEPSGR